MEDFIQAYDRILADYRQEVDAVLRKSRPTDGLLGFGHSLKDDMCHDRFDAAVKKAVDELAEGEPSAAEALRAARALLFQEEGPWPEAAVWMLRAVQRHCLALVPFLDAADTAALQRDYAARYRRWDRLPVQKQLLQALKKQANT